MVEAVRPTRSVLQQLSVSVPDIGSCLSDLAHPLVVKAQSVPLQLQAGQAGRIASLTDRVWLKAKVQDWRAAVGDLRTERDEVLRERLGRMHAWWWMCAAGHRQDDSPQKDFYSNLKAKATAGGGCDTEFLLPADWDLRRLEAEAALHAKRTIQKLMLTAARASLTTGEVQGISIGQADVRVRVSVLEDGQAYLAIGAVNLMDPTFYALAFTAFPGLSADDWLPEPEGAAGLDPAAGEILYSALLPPETQAIIVSLE